MEKNNVSEIENKENPKYLNFTDRSVSKGSADILVNIKGVEGIGMSCCSWNFCFNRHINPDEVNCDFRTLKKEKFAILNRVNEEKSNIREAINNMPNKNSFKAMILRGQEPKLDEKLKQTIMDKIMGIYKLKEVLENEFQVPNEYKNNIMLLRKEIILGIYKG